MSTTGVALLPKFDKYIAPEETTPRNKILQKIAGISALLGLGLLFTTLPIWLGLGVAALSAYAFYYLRNIDSEMSDGGYRLLEAAREGNRCMVKFLLFLGANPNIRPQYCPLSNAAVFGHVEVMKDLLAAGADVNTRGSSDRTPLHNAIDATQDEAVALLLQHGADPTIRTQNLNPGGNSYENALRSQKYFQEGCDHSVDLDSRTMEQRKIAIDRIVKLLKAHL